MICGIWVDEAEQFHPEQWVNLYRIGIGSIYHSSCQVRDLDLEALGDWEYGFEPTDGDGNPMAVDQARAIAGPT
jgi:hypothetical protein